MTTPLRRRFLQITILKKKMASSLNSEHERSEIVRRENALKTNTQISSLTPGISTRPKPSRKCFKMITNAILYSNYTVWKKSVKNHSPFLYCFPNFNRHHCENLSQQGQTSHWIQRLPNLSPLERFISFSKTPLINEIQTWIKVSNWVALQPKERHLGTNNWV